MDNFHIWKLAEISEKIKRLIAAADKKLYNYE